MLNKLSVKKREVGTKLAPLSKFLIVLVFRSPKASSLVFYSFLITDSFLFTKFHLHTQSSQLGF